MFQFMLMLHLIGVVVWIGGMVFAHFCLRPAALQLPPPQRLPLMTDALGRFFGLVIGALLLIWLSGLAMMLAAGMAAAPTAWHLMMGVALAMTLVFVVIRARYYPALRSRAGAQDWPAAGAALNKIRGLVSLNLALGFVVIAIATLGRLG